MSVKLAGGAIWKQEIVKVPSSTATIQLGGTSIVVARVAADGSRTGAESRPLTVTVR